MMYAVRALFLLPALVPAIFLSDWIYWRQYRYGFKQEGDPWAKRETVASIVLIVSMLANWVVAHWKLWPGLWS
jgi:hypothetical protein